jgi:hypothetical protein
MFAFDHLQRSLALALRYAGISTLRATWRSPSVRIVIVTASTVARVPETMEGPGPDNYGYADDAGVATMASQSALPARVGWIVYKTA